MNAWLTPVPPIRGGRPIWLARTATSEALLAEGDLPGALTEFRAALHIGRPLTELDPSHVYWQTEFAATLRDLADAGESSQTNFGEALTLLKSLHAAGTLPPEKSGQIGEIEAELAKLQSHEISVAHDTAPETPVGDLVQQGDRAYDRKDYLEAMRWHRNAADRGSPEVGRRMIRARPNSR